MDMSQIAELGRAAKQAALLLAQTGIMQRNAALDAMAQALLDNQDVILAANARDIAASRARGQKEAFVERLTLSPLRIAGMAQGLRDVAGQSDPIGGADGMWTRPNGLKILKVRVPLGVVGIIFESRPNVTADAAGICIKSGNACILRGGSEAIRSNSAIMDALKAGAKAAGLPDGCVELVRDTSREVAAELMRANEYLDVLIPRGGAGLIDSVVKNATVPVIETGTGNCHVYVDKKCEDFDMAEAVVYNSKMRRVSVCNAMETLLVHKEIAPALLARLLDKLVHDGKVEIRGCESTRALYPAAIAATEEDFYTEFSDAILAVKIVDSLDAAIAHINHYGTRHSESILTADIARAERFLNQVDAAAVYLNAATSFTDGGEFGFGAEIGISNQKLHARGPMGAEHLTTIKYQIFGSGQIRVN